MTMVMTALFPIVSQREHDQQAACHAEARPHSLRYHLQVWVYDDVGYHVEQGSVMILISLGFLKSTSVICSLVATMRTGLALFVVIVEWHATMISSGM